MNNPFLLQAEMQLLRQAHGEALRIARMGLTLTPDDPGLLEIAASCAQHLGIDDVAADCWQRCCALKPGAIEPMNNWAIVLERLHRYQEAEEVYRQALAILPDDASLNTNLGLLLENRGQPAEAEQYQRYALALSPESAEIASNAAGLLAKIGREEEAEALYRKAIALNPNFSTAHSNLGVLLVDMEREAEAEGCFREALRIQPDYLQGGLNLGQLLLTQGRLAEAWPLYENRQYLYTRGKTAAPLTPDTCPQWQGESLVGKSILVMPEQGLGDEIQFSRYLAWLKAQGPERLLLVCRPNQLALMQTLAGPDAVVSLPEAKPHLAGYDYWTFLLSLPRYAGTTLETIPNRVPYLHPDAQRVERLSPWLAGTGLRVGLIWQGNPKHSNDADRSLPGLETLAPLWQVDGVRFFSLQLTPEAAWPTAQPLVDLSPAICDFADTAALLSQLDLLISVDSSVAHLAGALGVPCWLLLPHYKSDWRWLKARDDTPWYPHTRLFRQSRRSDWSGPLAAVSAALAEQVGSRGQNYGRAAASICSSKATSSYSR
jgi:tetratricopeptide (TPR) repeat protein